MSNQDSKSVILVSFFHARIGPTQLFFVPENLEIELRSLGINDSLLKLLEFPNTEGIIILKFSQYWALNKLFEIDSQWSRGKQKEIVLLSYIRFVHTLDTSFTSESVNFIEKQFSETISLLQTFSDNYKALYIKDKMKDNINIQKSFNVWKKIIYDLFDILNVLH